MDDPAANADLPTRPLGATGLNVSEIGFGTWGLGGKAYGPTDDALSYRAIERAVSMGVNFFDTADLYGRSEEVVGQALAPIRHRVLIATKGGTLPHDRFHMPQDFSADYLRRALEQSLQRLRTDYVDLYQLHSPELDDSNLAEAVETLRAMQDEGLIRAWGMSTRSPADACAAIERHDAPVVQVNYNMIDHRARTCGLFALAKTRGVGLIARTPLCFGYLTGSLVGTEALSKGDHRDNWPRAQLQRWASAPGLFDALYSAAEQSPAQFALRFCLSAPEVSTVIPGMLTAAHVEHNVRAAHYPPLPAETLEAIEAIYSEHTFYDASIKTEAVAAELDGDAERCA